MDVYIKNNLRVKDYLRYCDDFCLFANDKAQLRAWRKKIRDFISERLGLVFSKSEIFPLTAGVDFLGYRHFPDFILLRKRTARRLIKRMRGILKTTPPFGHPSTGGELMGQVAAANGWMKHACTYNLQKKLEFEKLKRITGIKSRPS